MSRDDSGLYTGINSQSYAKEKEKRAARKSNEVTKAVSFKKDAKAVFALLDKQIASIPDQRSKLAIEDSAETWKSVGIALNMYEKMCVGLKKDLETLLSKTGAV